MGVLADGKGGEFDLPQRAQPDRQSLQASYVNVWETPEPWASITDAGSMLETFRLAWLGGDYGLNGQTRDLVHLMTRRGNTGTGGIAYLNVACSNDYGFGFSSAMSAASNFVQHSNFLLMELGRRGT